MFWLLIFFSHSKNHPVSYQFQIILVHQSRCIAIIIVLGLLAWCFNLLENIRSIKRSLSMIDNLVADFVLKYFLLLSVLLLADAPGLSGSW